MIASEVFSTPIVQFDIKDPDLNSDLKSILLAESTGPSHDRSNVGGWHSDGLQNREEECFKKLHHIMGQKLRQIVDAKTNSEYKPLWKVTSWTVINGKGNYNMPHCHPRSDWSVVYYVDSGDDVPESYSGNLLILDPRGQLLDMSRNLPNTPKFYDAMFGDTVIRLKPYTGLLVFFPSWLTHAVLPYEGDRPRIVISANYTLDSFKV